MKLVKIEWFDACSMPTSGWVDAKKVIKKLMHSVQEPCVSVGFVLKETPRFILVAAHLNEWCELPSEVDGTIAIPKSWIKSIKELKH